MRKLILFMSGCHRIVSLILFLLLFSMAGNTRQSFSLSGNKEAEPVDSMSVNDGIYEPDKNSDEMVMPTFPGGKSGLIDYLAHNIRYPRSAEKKGAQGRVIVSFVVERDGSISDIEVKKSVEPSLDREAMRVVAGMPRWIPGKRQGKAVRVRYTIPVTFRLQ